MSVLVTITVQSRTEAMRVADLAPHLKTWRGMKRKSKDGREWTFEGADVTLAYEGRAGGADLVNTIRCEAANPTDTAFARIQEFGHWLRSELGWELTEDVG